MSYRARKRDVLRCDECGRRMRGGVCPLCGCARCYVCAGEDGAPCCIEGETPGSLAQEALRVERLACGYPTLDASGSTMDLGSGTMARRHGIDEEEP